MSNLVGYIIFIMVVEAITGVAVLVREWTRSNGDQTVDSSDNLPWRHYPFLLLLSRIFLVSALALQRSRTEETVIFFFHGVKVPTLTSCSHFIIQVRSAGKSEAEPKIIHTHHHAHTPICSIDCKGIPNENAITEFYADLYQYYMSDATAAHLGFHVATSEPPSGKPENGGKVRMAKKRGSLQAIFVSSFLQNGPMSPPSISPPTSPTKSKSRLRALSAATPSSPTESVVSVASNSTISSDASGSQHQRKRSFTVGFNSVNSATPSRCSPPPAYLLDDDPFANLIAAPSITLKRKFSSGSSSNSATRPSTGSSSNDVPAVPFIPPVPPIPRSPLHEPSVPQGIMALVAPPPNSVLSSSLASSPFVSTSSAPSSPPPSLPRALSNGRGQTRPAYQRPAFSSRPSLPTLDTLARMNVVMTKKVWFHLVFLTFFLEPDHLSFSFRHAKEESELGYPLNLGTNYLRMKKFKHQCLGRLPVLPLPL